MSEFINHHSALILFCLLALVFFLVVWGNRRNPKALVFIVGIGLLISVGFLSIIGGQSDVETVAQFDSVVGSGKPVVVEFYSDT